MADPIIHNDVVVKNKVRKTKTPNEGLVTTITYKGSRAKLEEKFNILANEPNSLNDIDVSWGDTGSPSLNVTESRNIESSGGGEDSGLIQDYWEVDGNTVQDPVENNAYWDKDPAIDNNQKALVISEFRKATYPMPASITDEKAIQLWTLLAEQGVDQIYTYNVVLRYTQLCANGSKIKLNFSNIFYTWSLARVLQHYPTFPAYLKDTLDLLNQEWLKQPPRIRQVSKRRYQIISEWWSARNWISQFYPNLT